MGNIADIIGEDFDANSVEPMEFELLQPGWYSALVNSAEIKETKAKNGFYLQVEFDVDGGRKLWGRMNLSNPNKDCENIGKRELASLGLACGIQILSDTDQLVGKALQIKVVIRQPKAGESVTEPSNEIKGYKALEATQEAPATQPPPKETAPKMPTRPAQASAPATAPTAKPATAAPVSTKGKRPWER